MQLNSFNITALLTMIIDCQRAQNDVFDKTVSLSSSDDEIMIDCNKVSVGHILSNLLVFSWDEAPINSDVQVTIEKINIQPHPYVRIKMETHGGDITDQTIKELFENANITIDDRSVSSLLYETKELVYKCHGQIITKARSTGGFISILSLPINKVGISDQNSDRSEQMLKAVISAIDSSKTNEMNYSKSEHHSEKISKPVILTVEDNPDVLDYMEACLKDNYTVIKAINGQEGIKMVMNHNPDLILSDVMMPVMNGIDMTIQIRTMDEYAHVPIILVTAMSTEQDKINGLKAGATDYLTKPFIPDDLIDVVTKHIVK